MTKADERITRLEEAIARLEGLQSSLPSPNPQAVNPDGSPGLVAPGELIESAWGNAVSNEFKRNRAWGKQITTGGTFTGGPADFPGLSIVANFVPTKVYKVSAFISYCGGNQDGARYLYIVGGGIVLNQAVTTSLATQNFSLYASTVVTNSTGPITVKVQMSTSAGTLTALGSATQQNYILVEEISPVFVQQP